MTDFKGWASVVDILDQFAHFPPIDKKGKALLDAGQCASLGELARRIRAGRRMALVADEVGMGKTRIAVALIEAVRRAGGRSAVVLPPGIGRQWQVELQEFNFEDKTLLPLRSYESFIAGFGRPGDDVGSERRKRNHSQRLNDRRLQRELPANGWADEKILMISHSFAAMRFPRSDDWRRELLPAIAALCSGSRRNFKERGHPGHVRASHRAAEAVFAGMTRAGIRSLSDGDHRLESDGYRTAVLPLIGYALGQFDLVVTDEAHKSRGEDSSLSRILGPVTWESDDPFSLGMTATPVELDSQQWIDTIARIAGGKEKEALAQAKGEIQAYVNIVERLQREELDEALVAEFETVAEKFKCALSPYVLRRDKRDDPDYAEFIENYRKVDILSVAPERGASFFTPDWLRCIAASEALSHMPSVGRAAKRLRLAVPQRLTSWMPDDSEKQQEGNKSIQTGPELQQNEDHPLWELCIDALKDRMSEGDLYTHPAIRAAAALIESCTKMNEKVLVFGRFIAPLEALTRLLDAREMLRRIGKKEHWPAATVPEKATAAAKAAMRDQSVWSGTHDLDDLNAVLKSQYDKWQPKREREIRQLHREINGLAAEGREYARYISERWPRRGHEGVPGELRIAQLMEALEARRPLADRHKRWEAMRFLEQFEGLVGELIGEDDNDGIKRERSEATKHKREAAERKREKKLDDRLNAYLKDYSGREGNFARMMSGDTAPQTRRSLQAAFNRGGVWPMVLVAQSQVGREGLNLQYECRTVVLLHSEWNPGNVEQQIGRVDRKSSLWLRMLQEWKEAGMEGLMPTINIHPIVVRGTYDEYNWNALDKRWRALRAQLHGNIMADDGGVMDEKKSAFVDRIKRATPRFTPYLNE